ncbi:hypothetical protein TWF694_008875 [Orbilia ellipsospora]|uniref:NADP-dependent oxidoreductase domain-containing protein n=1 Tax=Orbilia ellipsospora TaxID=2528407 RepID=A0AAV9XFY7_9PEZI
MTNKKNIPLSTVIPPVFLGSATFNSQYNKSPFKLPTLPIISHFLSASTTKPGFDTSPYYGPAELLLGKTLTSLSVPRENYFISTKAGRISATEFDYSPKWIRHSISRSLKRLNTTYLDLVYCHDIEFVTTAEVLSAIATLRELRNEGKIKYIGISGYPLPLLSSTATAILENTGEAVDAVMSYSQYTVQNTRLQSYIEEFKKAGVGCVVNASLLGMGLLRAAGVPVGDMGDFHPSSDELRWVCYGASEFVGKKGGKLEEVGYRWALENWVDSGKDVGSDTDGEKIGVSVIGVSYLEEVESVMGLWKDILAARKGDKKALSRRKENDGLVEELKGVFGSWYDEGWESPGEGFARTESGEDKYKPDEERWAELFKNVRV